MIENKKTSASGNISEAIWEGLASMLHYLNVENDLEKAMAIHAFKRAFEKKLQEEVNNK